MKKIINNPSNFVDETIDGLIKSHPNIYSLASDNSRVITRAIKSSNKVGLVTGGGSGHLPVFTGYIGKGLLDSCAIGSVFASPSVEQIASAIRNANNGNGVLCLLGNYGGDVMNFEMACEIVKDEGIETKTVIVADDIASAKPEEKEKRRGIAGMIFVFKVAGALAETGASLQDVCEIALETNSNIRTLGVALSPCILPEAGKPTFEINDDEIEIGMGIHGEPGRRRDKIKPAQDITNELLEAIIEDLKPNSNEETLLFVNGMGGTPLTELYLVFDNAKKLLDSKNIKISRSLVGNFCTSLEMQGASITLTKLDEEIMKHWDSKVHTAAMRWGM